MSNNIALQLEPTEFSTAATCRLCVYSEADGDGEAGAVEWKLPVDKPIYRSMYKRVLRVLRGEYGDGVSVPKRLGVAQPWTALARKQLGGHASETAALSDSGWRTAARAMCFGDCCEKHTAACELCEEEDADGLHRVSGVCGGLSEQERRQHRSDAVRILGDMQQEVPAVEQEARDDLPGTRPPSAPRRAEVQQEVVERERGTFSFAAAHAGQCRSDEQMRIAYGTPELQFLAPWLAQAIVGPHKGG